MSFAFKRPALQDVTLVAVTSVALGATLKAIYASMEQADFGEILLLSDKQPPNLGPPVRWRQIEQLASRRDYSRFMLHELAKHIGTGFALCIQWDGYVLDGAAWQPSFLEYDYIGAPWPHFHDGYNVGNGGFSLRSQRLLKACTALPFAGSEPEDLVISRLFRPRLEAEGIRFAPEEVAQLFSYERMARQSCEFGFHGAFNLVRHLSKEDAQQIFQSLEPGILARSERWELFRWALARGRFRLARNMLGRLV
ncbi:MAG TPA: DUF5672 family protein [Sphingomicrobium sp.]|nr:DUF5672 family protein [Sphingomicrobium sp.]